jgi:hypothetical protein
MIDNRNAFDAFASPKTSHNSDRRPRGARVKRRGAGLFSIALLAALHPSPAYAGENDAVNVWNERAIVTLVNGPAAGAPDVQFAPPVAFIHLAIVQGAVYDAVNAIKGGHAPYLKGLKAPTSASKGAAASTAAHHVLTRLVDQAPTTAILTAGVKSTIKARLDAEYASSLAEIAEGEAKAKGINVGAAAAAAMLAKRVADGRFGAPGFPVAAAPGPGEWRPLPPLLANDPNGWVRNVRPFTLPRPEYFHTSGPLALTSAQYAAEFNEVKALGRATGSTRTAAQTSLAYWSAAHPAPMMYAAMRQVAASKGADDHRASAVPRHDQHDRGRQPDQLLGGKGPLGFLAPDDGDPARRRGRQRCDRARCRLDRTRAGPAVPGRAIGGQLRRKRVDEQRQGILRQRPGGVRHYELGHRAGDGNRIDAALQPLQRCRRRHDRGPNAQRPALPPAQRKWRLARAIGRGLRGQELLQLRPAGAVQEGRTRVTPA